MIEARKFTMPDFLAVAIAVALLFTFFSQTSSGEVIVVSTAKAAAVCTCPKGGECLCGPGCDCYQPVQLKSDGIPRYKLPLVPGKTEAHSDTGAAASMRPSGNPAAVPAKRAAAVAVTPARTRPAAAVAANCNSASCGTQQRGWRLFGRRR
jgi:hypothetical protein